MPTTTTTIDIRYPNGDVETFTGCTDIATVSTTSGDIKLTFKGKLEPDGSTTDEHTIIIGAGMRYTKKTVVT